MKRTKGTNKGFVEVSEGIVGSRFERALELGERTDIAQRLLERDATAFSRRAEIRHRIGHRLGWVDVMLKLRPEVDTIKAFADEVHRDGLRHVVVMGMGGSSLCPDLLGKVFGPRKGFDSYQVLDSTDPAAILAVEKQADIKKTLFIVASKSGGTIETRSHEAYFIKRLGDLKVKQVGRQFTAITDKGSELEKFARKMKYRQVWINPSDIGGRYSALSYFGLVPGAFTGVDLEAMLDDAAAMRQMLFAAEGEANPAVALAALIAGGAVGGWNKLTFLATKSAQPLVPWIEQLIAESIGKDNKGTVPIDSEPLGKPADYSLDRIAIMLEAPGEKVAEYQSIVNDFAKKKLPWAVITLGSKTNFGGQFLFWETVTAIAGYLVGVNPFDEPNVTEAKGNTTTILNDFRVSGEIGMPAVASTYEGVSILRAGMSDSFRIKQPETALIRQFFARAKRDYSFLSVLGYFRETPQTEKAMAELRTSLRHMSGLPTLRGYGPRYLHSIGQLYKGGPRMGMYIIFIRKEYEALPIPGREFGFGHLITAQAIGDMEALLKRKVPVLLITLEGDVAKGMQTFMTRLKAILR